MSLDLCIPFTLQAAKIIKILRNGLRRELYYLNEIFIKFERKYSQINKIIS